MKMRHFGKLNPLSGLWTAFLALLLFVSVSAVAQTNGALQTGKDLLAKSDFAGAVKAGREATAAAPRSAEAWLLLGEALSDAEDFDQAADALSKIDSTDSLTDDHHILMKTNHLLGNLYLVDQGELEKAQECFQKEIIHARELGDHADEASAHYNLGLVLERKHTPNGDPDAARKEFDEALKLETREAQSIIYRTSLADVLFLTGHSQEALQVIQTLDTTVNKSQDVEVKAKALFACGKLYTLIGEAKRRSDVQTERSQAVNYFDTAGARLMKGFTVLRAAKVEDWYAEALGYQLFGRLVETQGNIKEAVGRYRQALERAKRAGHHDALVTSLNGRIVDLSPLAKQEYIFGAIDIGSKGVKAVLVTTVVSDAKDKNAPKGAKKTSTTELYRRSINTDLNDSREANADNFSADAMKKTAVAVHDLIREMKQVRKPPFRITSIFVAGSSSLAQGLNRSELARQIYEETKNEDQAPANQPGATPETATPFINGGTELRYGIAGSINPEDRATATLVDIGSGNGRWGYIDVSASEQNPVSIEIRMGSVSLAAAAEKNRQEGEDYIAALEREANKQIGAPLRRQMKENSVFTDRPKVYIIGGAAYALATLMHPEAAKDDEVELTRKDLLDFYDRVKAGTAAEPYRPDVSNIKDADTLQLAKKQIDNVLLQVFKTREQLLSAAILLRTLAANALKSQQTIVFPRNGGWALGMAKDKYFADLAKTDADKLKPPTEAK